MEKPRLVLFDGNNLIHRAFHALPPLTVSKTGETVGAVYGFSLMLIKVINDLKPTHYAIAFDKKGPTFRHHLFEQYKATRPPTPDELLRQFGRVRQLVEAFNMPVFEIDGYEADDVLGSLARQASEKGIEVIIVTGDADAMQLVSPDVKVLYPKPRSSFSDVMIYDEAAVIQKYGLKPAQIVDFKALKGDPSDNIPGVPGIGDKTALKLLTEFSSLDEIYVRLEEVNPPKLREKLRENEALARRSKELATIVKETPVTLDINSCCKVGVYDRNQVAELLRELEFYSLVPKLPGSEAEESTPPAHAEAEIKTACNIVNSASALDGLLKRIAAVDSFAFDTLTTGTDAMSAGLAGIALSPAPGEAYYVPVGHIGMMQVEQLPLAQVIASLKPVLEDTRHAKLTHNGKFNLIVMAEHGINIANASFDTGVAAYLLGEKSTSLETIAFNKLGIELMPITELTGSGAKQIPISQVDIARAGDYACTDADMTYRMTGTLKSQLEQKELWKLFAEVEMPLVVVLMHMERSGIAIDIAQLREMSSRLGEQLYKLEADIYNNVGHQFNINSPSQLGAVLFEELHLEPGRKTRGKYSTEASVLESLRGTHPVIDAILEYRQLAKFKSTYLDALPALVNTRTGRVHTSFNQTRTTTGRLSSSEPNLQNIPVRGDIAKEIRQAFIAPAGSYLLAGDYSQIDLRALAHLSQDEGLLHAFNHGADIHSSTASQMFGADISNVTPEMRRFAKTINFGIIYGMSDYGLERATEMSREEAAKFITAYFEKYPGVKKYIESTKEQARTKGYVQTILGRRRYIPEINSPNRIVREAAERMAINMPVQGTSADIIKVAMINLYREMVKLGLKSKMLLQVHDELIFEVPEPELEEMKRLVPEVMCAAILLSVPLKVDIKLGKNWGELEKH